MKAYSELADKNVAFALVPSAPNLGAEPGDLPDLISAIEEAGVSPVMIALDTLAQSLGAGDENGSGMTALLANAGKLAQRFDCLVLIVHHVGHDNNRRMRGHSSLGGGVDAQILCERRDGKLEAMLTIQKLKDDASDVRFRASLARVVIGHDEDGDEVSTLIVDSVAEAETATSAPASKSIPPQQRLLMAVVQAAIDKAGGNGPRVHGVADDIVREQYYARIAEKAVPGGDRSKLAARQRRAFGRAVGDALKAQRLAVAEREGRRYLSLP